MRVKPIQRFGVNKGRSARSFRRDTRRTHRRNMAPRPMRGGFRL